MTLTLPEELRHAVEEKKASLSVTMQKDLMNESQSFQQILSSQLKKIIYSHLYSHGRADHATYLKAENWCVII